MASCLARRHAHGCVLSTQQALQCQPAACQALPLLPGELFPLLFKVAIMDKKTVVLRELVRTWPFPLLSFQQLLQECAHCSQALLRERPSTESVQAVIRGLSPAPHPGGRGWHTVLLQVWMGSPEGVGRAERVPREV